MFDDLSAVMCNELNDNLVSINNKMEAHKEEIRFIREALSCSTNARNELTQELREHEEALFVLKSEYTEIHNEINLWKN